MLRRANGTSHGLLATRCHRTLCKMSVSRFMYSRLIPRLRAKIYVPLIIPTVNDYLAPFLASLACGHVSRSVLWKIRGASPLDRIDYPVQGLFPRFCSSVSLTVIHGRAAKKGEGQMEARWIIDSITCR